MRGFSRRGALALTLALLAVISGLLAPAAVAQDTPILIFHVNWDAWNQGFPTSRIAQCWNDPVVQQWRSTSLQSFFSSLQAESGLDLNALSAHLVGQMAVVVMPPAPQPPPAPGAPPARPEPRIALAIHQPGQIDALLATINSNLDPQQQQMLQMFTLRQGDTVVFGTDPAVNQQMVGAMAGGAAGLGLTEPAGAFTSGRVNLEAIWNIAESQGNLGTDERQMLSVLGLANISNIQFSGGFLGGGLASDATIEFSSPRQGLPGLIGPNRSYGFLNLLPPNSLSVISLSTIPPPQILDWFRGLVQATGTRRDVEEMDEALMTLRNEYGLDLRNQVLTSLGQEIGLAIGGMTGMSMDAALFLEVTNQQPIEQAIGTLITILNQEMGPPPQPGAPQPPPMIQPMQMQAGNVNYTLIQVPGMPFQICYAFIGNHLVVTTSQSEINAVAQAAATGQSLMQAPGFQAVAPQLSPQSAMFAYSDSRQGLQVASQAIMPVMMMMGAGMPPEVFQLIQQIPALAQHLGSKGATIQAEPQRLTFHGYNTSGAEVILVGMVVVTAASAAMQSAAPGMTPMPAGPPTPDETITFGQTIQGQIMTGDNASLPPDDRAGPMFLRDGYAFEGTAGTPVRIDLTSDFDGYLFLVSPDGQIQAYNDDFGSTRASQIVATLNQTGTHRIVVTTYSTLAAGTYSLTLQ